MSNCNVCIFPIPRRSAAAGSVLSRCTLLVTEPTDRTVDRSVGRFSVGTRYSYVIDTSLCPHVQFSIGAWTLERNEAVARIRLAASGGQDQDSGGDDAIVLDDEKTDNPLAN